MIFLLPRADIFQVSKVISPLSVLFMLHYVTAVMNITRSTPQGQRGLVHKLVPKGTNLCTDPHCSRVSFMYKCR